MWHLHHYLYLCLEQEQALPIQYLFEEPGYQGSKDERVVGLLVVRRHADTTGVPQVPPPAIQVPGCRLYVKQDHIGAALYQPAPKVDLYTPTQCHKHVRKIH